MKIYTLYTLVLFLFILPKTLCAQEPAKNILDASKTSYDAEKYTETITLVNKALVLYSKETSYLDSLSVAKLYFYKGASEYYLERFNTSIKSYNKGMSFCSNTDTGLNFKAKLCFERAFAEYELDDFLIAYESSKEALLLMKDLKNPDYNSLLSIYLDVASEGAKLGFQKEAKNYLKKAEQLYRTYKSKIITSNKKSSKPVLFQYKAIEIINRKTKLNDNDIEQIKVHVENLEVLKSQKTFNRSEKRMYAVACNILGDAYLRKEDVTTLDIKQAHINLNKALKNLPPHYNKIHYYQFKFNEVKVLEFKKKYSQALKLIDVLLGKLPITDRRCSYFEAEKAGILLKLDNKKEALNTLKRCIEFIHYGETKLKNDYSNFIPSYDLNETNLLLRRASNIVEKYPKDPIVLSFAATMYRLSLLQFKNCYKEQVFNTKLTTYYKKAIGGIMKLKKLGYGDKDFNTENLLNTMEAIENRLVWSKFNQNRLLNGTDISDSIFIKEKALRKSLVKVKQKKDTVAIFEYTTQLKEQLVLLKEKYPNIAAFTNEAFDVEVLQKSMNLSQAILKYKKIGEHLYLFKITKTTINFYEIDVSKSIILDVEKYYNQLKQQQENKALANELFVKLFPFDTDLYSELTIIPDDVLHYLPFETLVSKNKNYLIENVIINYASHLVFVNNKASKNKVLKEEEDIVVFSPKYNTETIISEEITLRDKNYRLLGAEGEAKSLSKLFSIKLFDSILATKDNFIKYAPKAKIIHLAMHANIDNTSPELSYLLFNENNADSKMYIEELYGLHLNADLAVLSACNTGKKSLDKSEGIVSFNRSFTIAGIPSTIASLWEVPDKASQKIMIQFYKELKFGKTKARALQLAKLHYLKTTDDVKLKAPFYWAGFVLNGDSSPIILPNSKTNYILWIVIGVVIGVVLIFLFLIQKNYL